MKQARGEELPLPSRVSLACPVLSCTVTSKRLIRRLRNKLFDALAQQLFLLSMVWKYGDLNCCHILTKVQLSKFCKQTLNVPRYAENVTCRSELGRYPLDIKTSLFFFCYWYRLKYNYNTDSSLNEASVHP